MIRKVPIFPEQRALDLAFYGPLALGGSYKPCDYRKMGIVRSTRLHALSRVECLALLATAEHGHLAITEKALPAITPVKVQLVLDEVIIEPLLRDAISIIPGCVVALEAGTFGDGQTSEWTVEVCGFLNVWRNSPFTQTPDRFDGTDRFAISTDRVHGWMTQRDE